MDSSELKARFFTVLGNMGQWKLDFFWSEVRANFFWADGTGPRSFETLAAASALRNGLIPREQSA